MIKQFTDEPVTTWEPDEGVVQTEDGPVITTNRTPDCACCEQFPKTDCDNPACPFRF